MLLSVVAAAAVVTVVAAFVVVIVCENCNCKWIKSKKPTKVCKQTHPQDTTNVEEEQQQPELCTVHRAPCNLQRATCHHTRSAAARANHQRADAGKLSLKCTSTRIARKVRPLWCSHRRPSLGSVLSSTVNNEGGGGATLPFNTAHPPDHCASATSTRLLISHLFFPPPSSPHLSSFSRSRSFWRLHTHTLREKRGA